MLLDGGEESFAYLSGTGFFRNRVSSESFRGSLRTLVRVLGTQLAPKSNVLDFSNRARNRAKTTSEHRSDLLRRRFGGSRGL